MKEISFIVEFDEMNNTQIEELWKYLLDKNIKFHFLKEQKYKEVLDKALEYIKNNVKDDWGIVETSIVWKLEAILKEVE